MSILSGGYALDFPCIVANDPTNTLQLSRIPDNHTRLVLLNEHQFMTRPDLDIAEYINDQNEFNTWIEKQAVISPYYYKHVDFTRKEYSSSKMPYLTISDNHVAQLYSFNSNKYISKTDLLDMLDSVSPLPISNHFISAVHTILEDNDDHLSSFTYPYVNKENGYVIYAPKTGCPVLLQDFDLIAKIENRKRGKQQHVEPDNYYNCNLSMGNIRCWCNDLASSISKSLNLGNWGLKYSYGSILQGLHTLEGFVKMYIAIDVNKIPITMPYIAQRIAKAKRDVFGDILRYNPHNYTYKGDKRYENGCRNALIRIYSLIRSTKEKNNVRLKAEVANARRERTKILGSINHGLKGKGLGQSNIKCKNIQAQHSGFLPKYKITKPRR